MAGQGKLGVYWGTQGLSFVEVFKDSRTQKAFLPFASIYSEQPQEAEVSLLQDARLLEHIQRIVRNSAFNTSDIYLSIPSKDIIVRWFVIPWMRPYEIQGIVAFEARKYIPFPLEDLTYTYYPSTFVQGGVKQIGVVFVGIRKEIFQSYLRVFAQSGLNVVYCEPSSMSLLRALVSKKIVEPSHNVALLQISDNSGEISITSNGFVKFIRDFTLSSGSTAAFQDTADFLRAKLYNEVRISLDFFSRQHSEDVVKIVVLSSANNRNIADGVVADMGLPVSLVDAKVVLGVSEQDDVGAVGAFGVILSGDVPSVIDFNISEGEAAAASRKTDAAPAKVPTYIWPVLSAAVSSIIIGLTLFFNNQQIARKNAEVAFLKKDLGEFCDVPIEEIDSNNTKVKKFLLTAKDIPLSSSYTPIMVRLVNLMPKGMWLDSFVLNEKTVTESKGKVNKPKGKGKAAASPAAGKNAPGTTSIQLILQLSGYLFMNDTNAEFDEISRFVLALRSDGTFSKSFKDIKLLNMKAQDLDGRSVTVFSIICQ